MRVSGSWSETTIVGQMDWKKNPKYKEIVAYLKRLRKKRKEAGTYEEETW